MELRFSGEHPGGNQAFSGVFFFRFCSVLLGFVKFFIGFLGFAFLVIFYFWPYFLVPFGDYFLFF